LFHLVSTQLWCYPQRIEDRRIVSKSPLPKLESTESEPIQYSRPYMYFSSVDVLCLHQVISTKFIRLTRDSRCVSHPGHRSTLSSFEESTFRTVTKQSAITLPETATCMGLNLNCALPSMERPHHPIALVIPPVTPDLFLFLTRAWRSVIFHGLGMMVCARYICRHRVHTTSQRRIFAWRCFHTSWELTYE
jgi:hypothetical protein